MKESLSIVVPMYNEEQNAGRVIKSLNFNLNKMFDAFEIIVVESGSIDNTREIVEQLSKKYSNVKLFSQKRKEGLGSAIILGFRKSKGDLVLYMDGDEPFDIVELKRALPLIKDCDAVIGYRLGNRESFIREFYSKGYNFLIRALSGLKVKDVNFSFKLLRRKVADAIDIRSKGFFIDAEILVEMKKKGFRFKEMGIKYKKRERGKSSVKIGPGIIYNMIKEMTSYILR